MRFGYSNHPCDKEAMESTVRELLAKRCNQTSGNDWDWIYSQATGQSILDIGAVGHDINNTLRPEWKFHRLESLGKRVTGVDILEAECKVLQSRGHDVRYVDATSAADLGARFSLIIIGDVIEHVNDPVAILRFCQRHLEESGRILVATPNPHHYRKFEQTLRNGTVIDNLEHLAWFSPFQALEMGRRTGLSMTRYLTFIHKSRILRARLFGRPMSDCYSSNFVFEFQLKA